MPVAPESSVKESPGAHESGRVLPAGCPAAVSAWTPGLAGVFTVTVADALMGAKPAPEYTAVIVFAPKARLLPRSVRDAVAVPADPLRSAEPIGELPDKKITVPAGVLLPPVSVIVAATCVEADEARIAGLAETVIAGTTEEVATLTTTHAEAPGALPMVE
jgi:hypothetical protein